MENLEYNLGTYLKGDPGCDSQIHVKRVELIPFNESPRVENEGTANNVQLVFYLNEPLYDFVVEKLGEKLSITDFNGFMTVLNQRIDTLATKEQITALTQNIGILNTKKLDVETFNTEKARFALKEELPSLDGYVTEAILTGALSSYYTKEEIGTIVRNITTGGGGSSEGGFSGDYNDLYNTPDLSTYITAQSLANTLVAYATKDEIPTVPDLSNFATKDEIPTVPDLSNFAMKDEIPTVPSDIITSQSLANTLVDYALKSEISTGGGGSTSWDNIEGKPEHLISYVDNAIGGEYPDSFKVLITDLLINGANRYNSGVQFVWQKGSQELKVMQALSIDAYPFLKDEWQQYTDNAINNLTQGGNDGISQEVFDQFKAGVESDINIIVQTIGQTNKANQDRISNLESTVGDITTILASI